MPWNTKPSVPPIFRSCLGKEALDEWAARLKARRITRETGVLVNFYHCPHCQKFHIATDRRRSSRER